MTLGLRLNLVPDCGVLVGVPDAAKLVELLHADDASTGRPLGRDTVIQALEGRLEQILKLWRPDP